MAGKAPKNKIKGRSRKPTRSSGKNNKAGAPNLQNLWMSFYEKKNPELGGYHEEAPEGEEEA